MSKSDDRHDLEIWAERYQRQQSRDFDVAELEEWESEVSDDTTQYRTEYISASQIKKWEECPKGWWFDYVSDKRPTKGEKGYLERGSAVHESIEEVLIENPEERDVNTLTYLFKKEFRDWNPEIPDKMFDDALEYLEVAARYICDQDPDILDIEPRIEYDITRSSVHPEGEPVRIVSYLDVCTENEVWDWKTGTIRDGTAQDELIQGACYMASYYSKYGHTPDAIKFIYIKEETVRTLDPTDENWEELLKYIRPFMRGLNNEQYHAKPGDHCYWCDYEYFCSASDVGLGATDWERY